MQRLHLKQECSLGHQWLTNKQHGRIPSTICNTVESGLKSIRGGKLIQYFPIMRLKMWFPFCESKGMHQNSYLQGESRVNIKTWGPKEDIASGINRVARIDTTEPSMHNVKHQTCKTMKSPLGRIDKSFSMMNDIVAMWYKLSDPSFSMGDITSSVLHHEKLKDLCRKTFAWNFIN